MKPIDTVTQLTTLINQVKRRFNLSVSELGISGPQGAVLGYIFRHMENGDVFQKDIERRFNIRRSSATSLLKLMEREGLLRRECILRDARMKRIILSDKAEQLRPRLMSKISEFEKRMLDSVDPGELKTFLKVVEQLSKNMQ